MIAQDALEEARLDSVFFVIARQNPHKSKEPGAADVHRLKMLDLALKNYPDFHCTDIELVRSGPSYTVETVLYLKSDFPGDEFFWIVGEDQLPMLAEWKEVEELSSMVTFLCHQRPNTEFYEPRTDIRNLRLKRIHGHAFDVSSTEIRLRIKNGKPVDVFLPDSVKAYIDEHDLYGPRPEPT